MRCFFTLVALSLLAQAAPPTPAVIVVGFVGGFVRHNDTVHQEVQIADRLRTQFPSATHVEIFENHQGQEAYRSVLQSLDSDEDGSLSVDEKNLARIVLYGHSWGGSEAITLARALGKNGIPVLLTIQVDSVKKFGENDSLIPANVAQAVNFYQLDGFLHGRNQIQASDRQRTQILGNFKFDYKTHPVNCSGFPWFAQLFMKPHIEIESDPRVWNQVESLIRAKIVK
jgi:hypothetical protein